MLAGYAAREEVEELVLHLRDLVWARQELEDLLKLVEEDHLLARASPRPEPDQALW